MIELPSEATGCHGTNRSAVAHLLAEEIQQSDQHFEWLGSGFYLWQDSPWRAQAWAVDRFGDEAAAVAARVHLDGCADLLNPYWQRELADADDQYVAECLADGRPPAQNPSERQPCPGLCRDQLVLRSRRRRGATRALGPSHLRGG